MFLKKFGHIVRNARFIRFMQLLYTRLERDAPWQKENAITKGKSEVTEVSDTLSRGSFQRLPRNRP
jgi:hypothetical protein